RLTFAHRRSHGFATRRLNGTGLQAEALAILDGVLLVIQNAVQAFMQMRDVIAAIEIVIYENLPVALDDPLAAAGKMQRIQFQRLETRNQLAKIFLQRGRVRIEINEDEFFPDIHVQRQQTVLAAVEVADAIELWNSLERAIEAVGPAVVGATQAFCLATRFGHHRGSMMTADIEKSAQYLVAAA